jgi:hypothetical protein
MPSFDEWCAKTWLKRRHRTLVRYWREMIQAGYSL